MRRNAAGQRGRPERALAFPVGGIYPHCQPRFGQEQVSTFQFRYSAGFVTTSVTVPAFAQFKFLLSNISAITPATTFFDQYRVDYLEAWIVPPVSESNATTPLTGTYVTAIDLDDASTASSYQALQSYQNCVETPTFTGHYHGWVPASAVALYAAGVFTSYGNSQLQWVDCTSTGVEFYGLKLSASVASQAMVIPITVRATISFRGVRIQ